MKKIISTALPIIYCLIFQQVTPSKAIAQITPDATTNTVVETNGNVSEITGGETRGNNLFHSFQDFSVGNGSTANFDNATDISNIFSRVTGGNISNINGLIQANGNANLFLINPAGILLGESARLDIGGSFYGSSASSILFENGEFSAVDLSNPLLTINAPIGLGFRDNPGNIEQRSDNLSVNTGETIALVGGNVDLVNSVTLARGGSIELGGLLASGTILFNENNGLRFPKNINRGNVSFADSTASVSSDQDGSLAINANNLTLSASRIFGGIAPEAGFADARAGNIVLNATGDIALNDSLIRNQVNSTSIGNSGDVEVSANNLSVLNNSSIATNTLSTRESSNNAGNLKINAANKITIINDSVISSSTFGNGDGGNITIESGNEIAIEGNSLNNRLTGISAGVNSTEADGIIGNGQGGEITVLTPNLSLNDGNISSSSFGIGSAGNISINSDSINLANQSLISSSVGSFVRNVNVIPGLSGNSGQINIEGQTLSLTDGSTILTDAFAPGNAGNIFVNAAASVEISGTSPFPFLDNGEVGGFSSGFLNTSEAGSTAGSGDIIITTPRLEIANAGVISARSRSNFAGGNIIVNADVLEITGGGQILTTAFSNGNAGNINLNIAENILISGSDSTFATREASIIDAVGEEQALFTIDTVSAESGVFANTFANSTGDGGNISIGASSTPGENPFTREINLTDGGTIAVDSQGTGTGGEIFLQANDLTQNNQATILAETNFADVGETGGEINLQIDNNLILSNDSLISARARNNADGGNITINAEDGFVVAFPSSNQGSDIIASSSQGTGGNITISSQGILGIVERQATDNNGQLLNNSSNDIDASGVVDGAIEIITPDANTLEGIGELNEKPMESQETITQACLSNQANDNVLAVRGKGGISRRPTAPLSNETLFLQETISHKNTLPQDISPTPHEPGIPTADGVIVPARGLIETEDGELNLVGYATKDNQRMANHSNNCG